MFKLKKSVASLTTIALAFCLWIGSAPLLPERTAHASGTKITLTPAMVTNESGGDATKLVDEQAAAGNPSAGDKTPVMSTIWQPGWSAGIYPASAYIDLGQMYNLTDVYLFDSYDDQHSVTISAGNPGNWNSLFTYYTNDFFVWKQFPVTVATRYVRVTMSSYQAQIGEILLYGTPASGGGDTTPPATVTNLTYGNVTSSSVKLTWTAPGDNGNTGTAASYDIRYRTGPSFTEADWATATQAQGLPAPAAAGTSQSFTVGGLAANTTYSFAIKTKDAAGNESGISNAATVKTLPSAATDTTPPAPIADLKLGYAAASSINLTWTAPGDDGNKGTASSYEIRYSTSSIITANWADATLVSGAPTPYIAGAAQAKNVTGLSPNTTYYFAIRTKDAAGNVSDLSNVPSAKTSTGAVGGKIMLDSSMVFNETLTGDAGMLVDEQAISDPKQNPNAQPRPTTQWKPGDKDLYYPASAVIDLGTEYALSDLYWFDHTGRGKVRFYTGTPANWTLQHETSMDGWDKWDRLALQTTTRFVRVEVHNALDKAVPFEIVLYGQANGIPNPPVPPAPTTRPGTTMEQFIGINSFIDVPLDVMKVAGFVREYHNWGWDEGNYAPSYPYAYPNNRNKWNPSYVVAGSAPWNFDAYYQGLKNAGIVTVPAIQQSVPWLNASGKPVPTGADPSLPASYAAHADHMFQYAARYGSTAVADSKLKLAPDQPRSTGLGTLQYFENYNEPNANWSTKDVYFSPYEFAAMSSADYDGDQGRMGNTFGVKQADPNAKLVMGGLIGLNIDYLQAIKFWSDWKRGGSFPADVLNVHTYCRTGPFDPSGYGISPEACNLKDEMKKVVDYRNAYLPDKELWITEFGYDINSHSPQRAPAIGGATAEDIQAEWLVRSYLALAAAGVDKAAMFMIRDEDVNSWGQYASSGLVTAKPDHTPRLSWYYVYTLKNALTGMRYADEQPSGNPNVRIYKFKSATDNSGVYVVWAPTSSRATVNNYSLALQGNPSSATLMQMQSGNTNGVSSALPINGGHVTVNVSEKPIFVKVNQMP
ncbi:fibronectin type III domain-containing protein [Paenibacillus hodogayensis]|uniref:Fibronectin type III domain-containing protein n=1 Tax=Paenibacillus hodogayensis TaxID=279208 RepID=A0ABV5VXR4_9BACL